MDKLVQEESDEELKHQFEEELLVLDKAIADCESQVLALLLPSKSDELPSSVIVEIRAGTVDLSVLF